MQQKNYDIILMVNIPSFYAVNLYNRIAAKRSFLVIFTEKPHANRNNDFYHQKLNCDSVFIGDLPLIQKILSVRKILHSNKNAKLIVMGWDNIMYYLSILLHPKQNNAVGIESSILESVTTGVKGCIKKLFMRRVCTAYVSGKYQKLLAEALHFKGKMIVTKGVGIMNIVEKPPFIPVDKVQNFLYVGRLSPEKNLPYLVSVFNGLPDVKLNIIGFGPQEEELKRIAGKNITFYGAINNTDLPQYYRNNDVFILPSLSEPWGLVVEEALNNGLPVIISDRVGCRDEVVQDGVNGLIFSLQDADGLRKAVQKMQDVGFYNTLKKNAAAIDFNKIADEQVQCYCN